MKEPLCVDCLEAGVLAKVCSTGHVFRALQVRSAWGLCVPVSVQQQQKKKNSLHGPANSQVKALKQNHGIVPGDKVVVAVSGGEVSMQVMSAHLDQAIGIGRHAHACAHASTHPPFWLPPP